MANHDQMTNAEAREAPLVSVIIVAYRSQELLRACLTSLRSFAPRAPMLVHVVDNDSGDGTPEMVEREFPEVDVLRAGGNLGFSAANNLAIRRTAGKYVLVLNPDTRLLPGALEHLVRLMEERPEIGMCGPRLVREDGSLDHAGKRSFPSVLSALGHFTGVGRRAAGGKLAAYRAPAVEGGRVDAVNGAFMLIRRAALDEVGLFDEGYWMYMEDLDLCYRFARAGWITWYEPAVEVVHVKAGTTGPSRSARLDYAFHYGMHRFYRKWYAPRRFFATNAVVYAGIWAKFALSVTRSSVRRARARTPARLHPAAVRRS